MMARGSGESQASVAAPQSRQLFYGKRPRDAVELTPELAELSERAAELSRDPVTISLDAREFSFQANNEIDLRLVKGPSGYTVSLKDSGTPAIRAGFGVAGISSLLIEPLVAVELFAYDGQTVSAALTVTETEGPAGPLYTIAFEDRLSGDAVKVWMRADEIELFRDWLREVNA